MGMGMLVAGSGESGGCDGPRLPDSGQGPR